MTTKHLGLLCAVVLGTLSLIYLLPKALGYQPVGVVMKFPEHLGSFLGQEAEVTQKEKDVLGADTDFARKNYFNNAGDHVFASIVLSGQDMMTGIHRPERCLQAQGWSTGSSSLQTIQVPGVGPLEITRLQTGKKITLPAREGQPARIIDLKSVTYYFFVGYSSLAATHEQRVWMDFKDRVFHGYNQRWGMVMFSSEITAGLQRFGRDEKQTDELLVEFVKRVTPGILGDSVARTAARGASAQLRLAAEAAPR